MLNMLNVSLWLFNLGSLLLGMTLAAVILFSFGSRHGKTDASESCLISIICMIGGGLSVFFYVTAMSI